MEYPAALRTIQEEINSPILSNSSYGADIRVLAIQAMAKYSNYIRLEPHFDRLAQRYYREGLSLAGVDKRRQARLHALMALFYSLSARNGQAQEYLKREVALWQQLREPYHVIKCWDGFATICSDSGRMKLQDHFRSMAIEEGLRYFYSGGSPRRGVSTTKWLQFEKILHRRMDDIVRSGRTKEMKRLWRRAKEIADRVIFPKCMSYFEAACYFAIDGSADEAKRLLAEGEKIYRREMPAAARRMSQGESRLEYELRKTRAIVEACAGNHEEARVEFDRCLVLAGSFGMSNTPNLHRWAGICYEETGNYERGLAHYTKSARQFDEVRGSYSMEDRAAFFCNSTSSRSYQGRIRCLARLSRSGQKTVSELLAALDDYQARQFGEMVRPTQRGQTAKHTTRKAVVDALEPGELILAYVAMPRHLLIVSLSKTDVSINLVNGNYRDMPSRVGKLGVHFADKKTDLGSVASDLQALSKVFVEPVESLLRDSKTLVVVGDGPMTAIPFDMFSLDSKKYAPIVRHKSVRLTPSLRHFASRRGQSKKQHSSAYLGIADPTNTPGDQGLAAEARREVIRVRAMFPASDSEVLLGHHATERAVKRLDLRKHRYLHFSTHGFLTRNPDEMLSEPGLVLGRGNGEDGLLTSAEVRELSTSAELCLLSACETGRGATIPGEGVLSLGRSFLVSGSQKVLMTQWRVDVKATEEFIVRFVRRLDSGMAAQEALRQTKLDFLNGKARPASRKPASQPSSRPARPRSQPNWRHPYYWGAFVLLGS